MFRHYYVIVREDDTIVSKHVGYTRYLIMRTQIVPNLQINFYIFTAPNTTGSNHS